MNKAIIIVDAFLYSKERIELFEKVLKKINQIDLPILLISNSTISESIQKQVDYFIYDKSNILFEYEYESYPFCNNFLATEHFIWEQHIDTKQKHGLSVLCNLTKAYDFATKQGFNKLIRLEWDFLIHEDDLNKIKNAASFFPLETQKVGLSGISVPAGALIGFVVLLPVVLPITPAVVLSHIITYPLVSYDADKPPTKLYDDHDVKADEITTIIFPTTSAPVGADGDPVTHAALYFCWIGGAII